MGVGPSTGQGRLPPHDTRDVRTRSADTQQYDWSQLAEAPETNTLLADAKPYNGASNAGPSSAKDKTYRKKKSSVMKDDRSSSEEDVRDDDDYNGAQQRNRRSPRSHRKSPSPQPDSSSDEEEEEERRSSRRREKTRGTMRVEPDTGQNAEPDTGVIAYAPRRQKNGSMQAESRDPRSYPIKTAYTPTGSNVQVEPDTGENAEPNTGQTAHLPTGSDMQVESLDSRLTRLCIHSDQQDRPAGRRRQWSPGEKTDVITGCCGTHNH